MLLFDYYHVLEVFWNCPRRLTSSWHTGRPDLPADETSACIVQHVTTLDCSRIQTRMAVPPSGFRNPEIAMNDLPVGSKHNIGSRNKAVVHQAVIWHGSVQILWVRQQFLHESLGMQAWLTKKKSYAYHAGILELSWSRSVLWYMRYLQQILRPLVIQMDLSFT